MRRRRKERVSSSSSSSDSVSSDEADYAHHAEDLSEVFADIKDFIHANNAAQVVPARVEAPALPDYFKPAKQEAKAPSGITRASDSLLREMVTGIDAWIRDNLPKGPLTGTNATVRDPNQRRHVMSSSAVRRTCDILDVIHATIDSSALPQGDDIQKILFATASRPPFRALSSTLAAVPATANVFAGLMQNYLALSPSGFVRLPTQPYFLFTGEWRLEYAEHGGFAFVLEQCLPNNDSTFPQGVVVPLSSIAPLEMKRAQFRYLGYILIDNMLVAASAGTPDLIPM